MQPRVWCKCYRVKSTFASYILCSNRFVPFYHIHASIQKNKKQTYPYKQPAATSHASLLQEELGIGLETIRVSDLSSEQLRSIAHIHPSLSCVVNAFNVYGWTCECVCVFMFGVHDLSFPPTASEKHRSWWWFYRELKLHWCLQTLSIWCISKLHNCGMYMWECVFVCVHLVCLHPIRI